MAQFWRANFSDGVQFVNNWLFWKNSLEMVLPHSVHLSITPSVHQHEFKDSTRVITSRNGIMHNQVLVLSVSGSWST